MVGPQSSSSATHTYAAGTWTCTVTVTDNAGATASASKTVSVSAANQPPVASLTVSPSSGTAPLSVTANASGSSDPDGTITSYKFNFGGTCRLTVTDNLGATGSASVVVTVTGLLIPTTSQPADLGHDPFAESGIQLNAGTLPRVIPNPTRGDAYLAFANSKPGDVSIRIFDTGGRSVRTVLDKVWAPAGSHVVPLDGRRDDGAPLRAGVYYFRIRSVEGARFGRFAIIR